MLLLCMVVLEGDVVHPPSSIDPYAVACSPSTPCEGKETKGSGHLVSFWYVLSSCLVKAFGLLRGSAIIHLAYRCRRLCKKRRNTLLDRHRCSMRVLPSANQHTMVRRQSRKSLIGMPQGFAIDRPGPGPSQRPQSPVPTHLREAGCSLRAHGLGSSWWRHGSSHARRTRRECVKLNASA